MFKSGLCALGLLALAGPANSSSVLLNVYNNGSFTENYGSGITFSGPPSVSEILSLGPHGFTFDWTGPPPAPPPLPAYVPSSNQWGADFRGLLEVARSGSYQLTFGTDDAGYLFIDGVLQASTPGAHALYTVTPTVALTAGTHHFEIQYDNTVCCLAAATFTTPEGVILKTIRRHRHWR